MPLEASKIAVQGLDIEVLRGGRGRPLLFLHPHIGMQGSARFLDVLSGEFDVIAPSHPGFGRSELVRGFDSVDDLAYFYLDFLEALDLRDVVVVGSSFGGWIALEMAIKSVARIDRLVIVDSVGVKFGGATEVDIADIFSLTEARFAELAYYDQAIGKTDVLAMSDDELLVAVRNRESSALYAWLPCMYDPKLRRRLHRVDLPTLVLWGAADRITEPSYGSALASAVRHGSFREISAAGHFPHIEQPDRTAGEVIAFAAIPALV